MASDTLDTTSTPSPTPLSFLTWFTIIKGFLIDLFRALSIACPPTLSTIWRTPGLLLHPRALQDVFMGFVWDLYGDGIDGESRDVKEALVRPHARGVVLEIGAGAYIYFINTCSLAHPT